VPEARGETGRTRRWTAAALGLLPHVLPLSWVVAAAAAGPPDSANAPLALLVEIPLAVLLFVLARDFRGRVEWVRPVLRTTAVVGAVAVTAVALAVGATG